MGLKDERVGLKDERVGLKHERKLIEGWKLPPGYLVEHVSLAAQVEVRQDAGGPYVGDGQAGLGDTGRHQCRLALTQAREVVGELCESTWNPQTHTHTHIMALIRKSSEEVPSSKGCFGVQG